MPDHQPTEGDALQGELICCDVFERLHDRCSSTWTDEERSEYRRHSICYWSEAARRIWPERLE